VTYRVVSGQWGSRLLPARVRPGDEPKLTSLLRSSTLGAGLAQRARIVLLAAQGLPNAEIARRVGMSRPTVIGWRNRYETGGIRALGDLDRSGRPPVIDDASDHRNLPSVDH
jgi:DNA-binding CsgD family transcriptional regulator